MIADYLQIGKKHKTSFSELMRITGYTERTLRKKIAEERKNGALIISDHYGGYYLAENEKDIERYIAYMSKEAASIYQSLSPFKARLKIDPNQQTIEEYVKGVIEHDSQ